MQQQQSTDASSHRNTGWDIRRNNHRYFRFGLAYHDGEPGRAVATLGTNHRDGGQEFSDTLALTHLRCHAVLHLQLCFPGDTVTLLRNA
jgi:hypothetical protein